jgi:hypothetical protein
MLDDLRGAREAQEQSFLPEQQGAIHQEKEDQKGSRIPKEAQH